jgi:hypothetical protein
MALSKGLIRFDSGFVSNFKFRICNIGCWKIEASPQRRSCEGRAPNAERAPDAPLSFRLPPQPLDLGLEEFPNTMPGEINPGDADAEFSRHLVQGQIP